MGAMSLDIVDAGLAEPQTEEVVDYEVDSDVKTEEERVLSAPIPSGQPDEDVIHIRKLRKVYGGGDSIDLMLFGIAFLVAFVLCLIYSPTEWSFSSQSASAIIASRSMATLHARRLKP